VDALIQMEAGVAQRAHQLLRLHQLPQLHQLAQLHQPLRLDQLPQLEDATQDGLVMHIAMISITTWTAVMMVETVVDVMSKQITAMYVDALIQMEAGVAQRAHQLLRLHQLPQELVVPQQALQIQQQLEDATQDGLATIIVMISITTWAAAMMVVTVVDVTLTQHGAQYADALTQMETGVEQLAHLLQQLLIIQTT